MSLTLVCVCVFACMLDAYNYAFVFYVRHVRTCVNVFYITIFKQFIIAHTSCACFVMYDPIMGCKFKGIGSLYKH